MKRTDGLLPESQKIFIDELASRLDGTDILLVKVLMVNVPIVDLEFGVEESEAAADEIEAGLHGLSHASFVRRMSPVLFAVIAEDASNPAHFIRQILGVISAVNVTGRYRFTLETSVGAVVTEHAAGLTAEEWVARLNLAVIKSTRTGSPEIADESVALSERLRQRLARLSPGSAVPEGMYWVFQPINYAATGEIYGYEALVRWDIPELGLVPTQLVIDVAEDLNLVQIIDFWALQAVEAAYPELVRLGGQVININVSAQTLGNDHEFFSAVDALLPRISDGHFTLVFELTETSIVKNQVDLRSGLISLRERGVRTAIDDFGTGETSLSLISRLPTDYVKLDGSLLEADRPDLSRGLLELGVKFAELIGAAVIVEKVETRDDLDLANEVGAEFVQGWYFGKPLDLRASAHEAPQSH
jgi:EAL domain-containing protein (putative c-di-GMP-specific phosphodiesterase class I)